MNANPILRLICLTACAAWVSRLPAATLDDYNVVWDSPSRDHHGSMPLGNGDIALNAWMTGAGELHIYIAKTDAWDDNARLVKVGKVRVLFEPSPVSPGSAFRQELKLGQGCIEIRTGEPVNAAPQTIDSPQSTIRLWVDAQHPVIHVTAESGSPMEATAVIDLWRTNRFETENQVSDVLLNRKLPDGQQAPLIVEPDTLLSGQRDRIGWFHHNVKSVGPQLMAEIQGLTGFAQSDPLLHRTFGAMITAAGGERLDDRHLRSPRGPSHRFSIYVLTRHPATPEQWLADLEATIRQTEARDFAERRAAHDRWWQEFWDRSWIRASLNPTAKPALTSLAPANTHPVRLGSDQSGGNRFSGEIGRLTIVPQPLSDAEIAAAAEAARRPSPLPTSARSSPAAGNGERSVLFAGADLGPQVLSNSVAWNLAAGFTIEAWVKPAKRSSGSARLVDKITPGGSDGWLLDTHPANSLRFICGDTVLQQPDVVPADRWTHVAAVADPASGSCRLYVNGQRVASSSGTAGRDAAAQVSQMYHLQRFITACAGRGSFPIKFNGSLFTVPPGPTEQDPDFRRWGPGYWWQNTRLPYISLCTSGDFDLQAPLFRLYATELLPLYRYRTSHYFGHGGAYFPECVMFWGAVFSDTYGWTPFEQRTDKLQASGWHKWEWVCGPELAAMMLDYYDHTLDRDFLQRTALPCAREVLTFFDQHYATDARGQLVMHPSQALETWWRCTNATPELAGCTAVVDRLLRLPEELTGSSDRQAWQRFRKKLPPIPLRDVAGRPALAPAEFFAQKSNIENPELYPVFPFRLFAFNRPHAEWALTALEHRWDRGHSGWRQDDIFMAYLGLTEPARQGVVSRARSHDPNERFPAFWGPNYDWTPDQDHGGVLMKAFQALLFQTDGDQIFLLPAWPKDWDVEFKLHAPRQTTVAGVYRDGKMQSLRVSPESRRADTEILK